MVRRQGSPAPVACALTSGRFDTPMACEEPAACERAAGDLPYASSDCFAADLGSDADV